MELSLYHLVREPKVKKEKNPLLLLVHGYGSNEQDLFGFAGELPDEYYIISVRAPYNLQGNGFAWYAINFDADMNKFTDDDQARASRNMIAAFIDEAVAAYPIDKDNVTLIGFSQGAILSYGVSLTYPEKVSRVLALSGYLHKEIVGGDLDIEKLKHLKYFISHGTSDQVIPVAWARMAPEFLKTIGLDVAYHEYPVGHGVAPQNFADLLHWLNT
jgi:phospholipase/carboxylesterase